MPDGKVQLAVPSGLTFEQARAVLEKVQKVLELDSIPLVYDGEIEQHKHEGDVLLVRKHQHA